MDEMNIWSGKFQTFSEASSNSRQRHDPLPWIGKSRDRAERMRSSATLDIFEIFTANPLILFPPIASLLKTHSKITITDVGGNLGQLATFVSRFIPVGCVKWNVVEVEELINHPQVSNHLTEDLSFFSNLNGVKGGTNILYFGSSIQYIEHLELEVFDFVKREAPEYIVIADGMVGDNIPTFVTRQKYYDTYFVSKFRNFGDLDASLKDLGYSLLLKHSALNSKNASYYPSAGLPRDLQIPFPLDLLYNRNNEPLPAPIPE
jgi:putative methyltransferase (TIGR04325 family)